MTSPARSAASGDHRPARWVRTRLRTAPWAALLTAGLAFALVFLAAVFPRVLDRGADAALRDFLHDRGPLETSLLSTAAPRPDRGESAADLESVAGELLARTGAGFSVAPSGPVFGAEGVRLRALTTAGLDRPDGVSPPTLNLLYLHAFAEHSTLVAGAWPSGGATAGDPIPIAVALDAAEKIKIRLGDVIGDDSVPSRQVRVTGFYTVTDPADPFWADLPCTGRACLVRSLDDPNIRHWHTAAVVGGDDLGALAVWGHHVRDFWRLPVDIDGLRADRLAGVRRDVAAFMTGPTATGLVAATGRTDLATTSRLPGHLERAVVRQAAVAPLALVGPAAVAGVAGVVLALATALTMQRRGAELRLLRARGASGAGVLARLSGESAVAVLPAAVAATALALWLWPTPRWTAAVTAALVVTLLALLAVPVRAALPPARDLGGALRRGRYIAELAVLVLTVAAVAGVRRRSAAPPNAGPDLLLVAAPLLIALTAALLLARLLPHLSGILARAAARGRGTVGFLGLARAARDTDGRPRPSVLPLLALVLAVTTAGFGASVLEGVDSARQRAARLIVGADAYVTAPAGATLPPGFAQAAAALPGVSAATGVRLESEAFLLEGVPGARAGVDPGATQVTLVVAEPQAYARIARVVGAGVFDPAALAGAPAASGPAGPAAGAPTVPALFSADLARRLGPGGHRLRLPSGGEVLTVHAGTVDATPALPGATRPFVVLPTPAAAVLPELARITDWFAVGPVDEPALARLVHELPPSALADPDAPPPGSTASTAVVGNDPDALRNGYLTRTSAAVTADLARDPLQHAAGRLFLHAVLAAGALTLLAVLLTLLRAAPDRAALLARLRTMGLRSRQGLALVLAETLPQTLAAAPAARWPRWRPSSCSARRSTCPRWSGLRCRPACVPRRGRSPCRRWLSRCWSRSRSLPRR